MKYVYPKLSKYDLGFIRLGGAGLGNLLFAYARALKLAKENEFEFIWPTWASFKLGTYLRREKDKRNYTELFKNYSGYIHGIKKFWLLLTHKKFDESEFEQSRDDSIIVFEKFIGSFKSISDCSALLNEDLRRNLKDNSVLSFNPKGAILVHVRLGDFMKATENELKDGKHDSRLPIEWYRDMIYNIRKITGSDNKTYIFSDGTDEELRLLLDLPNVERLTFGNAINDIIALSKAPLFIASGSSFSMWARFLGRMNTICYKNQIKEKILNDEDKAFEIEVENEIPEQFFETIRKSLM